MHFYQGFTNEVGLTIHDDPEINEIVSPYFNERKLSSKFYLDENDVQVVATLLKASFPRVRNFNRILLGFKNIESETEKALNEALS